MPRWEGQQGCSGRTVFDRSPPHHELSAIRTGWITRSNRNFPRRTQNRFLPQSAVAATSVPRFERVLQPRVLYRPCWKTHRTHHGQRRLPLA